MINSIFSLEIGRHSRLYRVAGFPFLFNLDSFDELIRQHVNIALVILPDYIPQGLVQVLPFPLHVHHVRVWLRFANHRVGCIYKLRPFVRLERVLANIILKIVDFVPIP